MRIPTILILTGIPALLITGIVLTAWLLLLMLLHHAADLIGIAAIVLLVVMLSKHCR